MLRHCVLFCSPNNAEISLCTHAMLTLDVHSWYTYLYGVMQTWTKHCLVYRFHTGLHNTTGFGQVCITITPQVCITNNTVLARFCSGLHHRAKPWPSYGVKEIDHTMHHWRTCMRCHLTHLHAEHAHAAPWCSQLCSHLGLGCTSVAGYDIWSGRHLSGDPGVDRAGTVVLAH